MHTHHARRVRGAGPARRVTLEDLHRWVDDGGAVRPDAEGEPPPVTWSPVALRARLEAQRALHAMPRRPRGRAATARMTVDRIVTQVEQRRLSMPIAAEALRAVTVDLRRRAAVDAGARAPHAWELLRRR